MSRRTRNTDSTSGGLFDNTKFYFGAEVDENDLDKLETTIETNGGAVLRRWAKTADYAISTSYYDRKLENAIRDGVPRVRPAFVYDSVKAKSLQDPKYYQLYSDADEDEDDEDDEENDNPNTSTSKGRTKATTAKPKAKAAPAPAPASTRKRPTRGAPVKTNQTDDEDDDDEEEEEEEESTPKPKRGRAKPVAKKASAKAKPADRSVSPPAAKRQRGGRTNNSNAIAPAAGPDNDDDDDDDQDDDEEEEEEEESSSQQQVIIRSNKTHKKSISVDQYVPGAQNFTVYYDKANEFAYDFMLNQTNINHNNNKFYLIQLLQHTNGTFACFFRWGRVGVVGQQSFSSGLSLDVARSQVDSKLRDKSGYSSAHFIANRNPPPKSGKYIYLERSESNDDDEDDDEQDDAVDPSLAPAQSKLNPKVKELIEMISDIDMITKQLVEIGYDARKLPLGKLSKDVIKLGYETLKEIEEVLDEREKLTKSGSRNGSKLQQIKSRINELSSLFYSRIPHDFGRNVPTPIDNATLLKNKIDLVESLAEVEVAKKIIATTSPKAQLIEHPADAKYAQLNCTIKHLDPSSEMFKYIEQYVRNTHGSTHTWMNVQIIDVFELCRQTDDDRFDNYCKDIGNRQLLWHGSRLTNFVGILSSGLRIAPPEVPNTGTMFDKGIYTADAVSKSANYCTTNDKNEGCILLCEVAMGNMEELKNADHNASKHLTKGNISVKGLGLDAPRESDAVYVDLYNTGKEIDKVKIPLGKLEKSNIPGCYLQYNEYIVYDVAQVKLKYLIRFKNTKKGW